MYKVIVSQKKALTQESLKQVIFKTNHKPIHVDVNMKH